MSEIGVASVLWLRPSAPAQNPGDLANLAYDYVETPFAEQVRVPMASFGRGRVQLGGFYRLMTTENMMLGPPDAGNFAAASFILQAHPGLVVPRVDESYGLRLSIRLKRSAEPGSGAQFWQCLKWAVGAGHRCHVN